MESKERSGEFDKTSRKMKLFWEDVRMTVVKKVTEWSWNWGPSKDRLGEEHCGAFWVGLSTNVTNATPMFLLC